MTRLERNWIFKSMDTLLPFVAYGLFKPGQICFLQIKDFVVDASKVRLLGRLLLRDGLALYEQGRGYSSIQGYMLRFRAGEENTAYDRIKALEPERQYSWTVVSIDGHDANVLVGRSPQKGSVTCDEEDYDGWSDPLFVGALDVVEETLEGNREFDWDLKPLFRLQMAYLLLWASIERYSTLRYGFAKRPEARIDLIGHDLGFERALKKHVRGTGSVQRADEPMNRARLNPEKPLEAIKYYYQVRCNSAHRGKAVPNDHDIVESALDGLLSIFKDMLNDCREEANQWGKAPSRK